MPDPITPNSPAGRAARAGRAVPEPSSAPSLQPRRSRLLLVGLPMFAVFAANWFLRAYYAARAAAQDVAKA